MKTLTVLILATWLLMGCEREPGCSTTITGNGNSVACGGSGDDSDADVTTPAPVIVPPVVITPVITEPAPEGP